MQEMFTDANNKRQPVCDTHIATLRGIIVGEYPSVLRTSSHAAVSDPVLLSKEFFYDEAPL